MPTISILLPVFNGANYLQSSIDSVLGQSFEDFTLHVLDDGSTDGSAEIARSYKDKRLRYSRNDGRFGLFKTLNRGFAEARSELVRIWAHDDLMLPNCLSRFSRVAETFPAASMFYCDFYAIDERGHRTGKERAYESQRARTPPISGADTSAALFLCFGCLPGNISTVMLKRSSWEGVGGFAEGIQQAPDYEMWLRLSGIFDVAYISEKLIELRDHPLQLAKLGQTQMTTITEELAIYCELRCRLGDFMTPDEFRSFWSYHRGRQHIHWIVRALLRGDASAAARGWRAVEKYGAPWRQAVCWAVTGNGRFTPIKPEIFYDTLLQRVCKRTGDLVS